MKALHLIILLLTIPVFINASRPTGHRKASTTATKEDHCEEQHNDAAPAPQVTRAASAPAGTTLPAHREPIQYAHPQAQPTQSTAASSATPAESAPAATPDAAAPKEDETAAVVLQTWGKLAGNMVNIIKDPNNAANVATNVGALFAGFASILGEIVKRNGKNNPSNLMALLESPEVQQWLVKEISQNPK